MLNKNLKIFEEILSLFFDELSYKLTIDKTQIGIEVTELVKYRMNETKIFVQFYNLMEKFYDDLLKHFLANLCMF